MILLPWWFWLGAAVSIGLTILSSPLLVGLTGFAPRIRTLMRAAAGCSVLAVAAPIGVAQAADAPPGMANSMIWVIVLGLCYFIPALIASRRKHHQRTAIFLLNLLLGWTFLGWVGALVWSVTAVQRDP